MVVIKRAIEPYERQKAKQRQSEAGKQFGRRKDNQLIGSDIFPEPSETMEKVAGFVGVSYKYFKKQKNLLKQENKNRF